MTIKEIVICAFKLLGRNDIAQTLSDGGTADGECADKLETMLYCVNAVEDELVRYYFPLKKAEEFVSSDGKFAFDKFAERPIKILSVKSAGKETEYSLFPQYLQCGKSCITVEYEYAPQKKALSGISAFDGTAVGEQLIASGAAAEYCLISGAVNLSKTWESHYRCEIDCAREKFRTYAYIPPRRWV